MSGASIKRNAFRSMLLLHFIGLALVIGVRFSTLAIEHLTAGGTLQALSSGRDLMGALARTLTLPGFLLTIVTGVVMVVLRYGRRVPVWVWMKVGLTTAALSLATPLVAPALEAARTWAHWSIEHGQLAPQLHDSIARAGFYGSIVFALILLNVAVAVWKPFPSLKLFSRAAAGTQPNEALRDPGA